MIYLFHNSILHCQSAAKNQCLKNTELIKRIDRFHIKLFNSVYRTVTPANVNMHLLKL